MAAAWLPSSGAGKEAANRSEGRAGVDDQTASQRAAGGVPVPSSQLEVQSTQLRSPSPTSGATVGVSQYFNAASPNSPPAGHFFAESAALPRRLRASSAAVAGRPHIVDGPCQHRRRKGTVQETTMDGPVAAKRPGTSRQEGSGEVVAARRTFQNLAVTSAPVALTFFQPPSSGARSVADFAVGSGLTATTRAGSARGR